MDRLDSFPENPLVQWIQSILSAHDVGNEKARSEERAISIHTGAKRLLPVANAVVMAIHAHLMAVVMVVVILGVSRDGSSTGQNHESESGQNNTLDH